jgi:hypothetical protein
MTMEPRWYDSHDAIVEFASILIDAEQLDTPREVLRYFEKPWKWTPEYELWVSLGKRELTADDIETMRAAS